jgi:phage gp29-like protein
MNLLEKLIKAIDPRKLAAPAGESRSARSFNEWDQDTVVAGLTPAKLSRILRESATGDATAFLKLAEEMEELDPHYRSVLQTRKLAVAGIEPEVVAAGEDKLSQEVATFVKEIVEAPIFADLIMDLLDGLGKGYSVVEIEWDTSGNQWRPQAYVWRDPSGFLFDAKTRTVMEKNEKGEGVPLEPLRFCVHVPKLKSGLPVRGALARLAAWSFLFKNYTVKDWMRFIEVYGMPLRIGKYGANANEDDKRKLLSALRNMGTDAAAIVPQSAVIEFVQAASGTASQGPVFGQMADYLDKQVSKGVLGQTMTSDNGSSKAQAEVHNEVRLDIRQSDARQVVMTLARDIIMPAVAVNFGMQKKWPLVRLPVEEPEDMEAWADNAGKMMDRGLAVSVRQVREKLLLDEPVDADDTLTGKVLDASEPAADDPKTKLKQKAKAARLHGAGCPCCGGLALASRETDDAIDELLAEALAASDDDLEGLVKPVLKLAEDSANYDEFIARLSHAAGEQQAGVIVERLGPLMFLARGLGDATDEVKV